MDRLITRLTEAEAGSRELDREVWAYIYGAFSSRPIAVKVTQPVTTSVDAILALIGERMPKGYWEITYAAGRKYQGHVAAGFKTRTSRCTAKTPALALCAALLTALENYP